MPHLDPQRLLQWLSAIFSIATAATAFGAAWWWRTASKVRIELDALWLKHEGDMPDFPWIHATMQQIEKSGALNSKAATWSAASALLAGMAAATSSIALWLG